MSVADETLAQAQAAYGEATRTQPPFDPTAVTPDAMYLFWAHLQATYPIARAVQLYRAFVLWADRRMRLT